MLVKTLSKKVSFQWTFEDSHDGSRPADCSRRAVLRRRRRGPAPIVVRRRHDEIGRWRGAQETPWFRTRDRADGAVQVAQCGPLNALVNQYAQLVLDALRYAQPVEVGKERSDMWSWRLAPTVINIFFK